MSSPPLRAYDGSELDEQLRRVENLLRMTQSQAAQKPVLRFDPAQPFDGTAESSGSHLGRAPSAANSRPGMGLSWGFLTVGLAAFVCAAALAISLIVGNRPDLWNVAIPAVIIVGQLAIVVGLVLQLDRVWEDNRQNTLRLTRMHDELQRIHQRTGV